MSNEKVSFNSSLENYARNKLEDIHSPKSQGSSTQITEDIYTTKSATDNHPSKESVEHRNRLDLSKPKSVVGAIDMTKRFDEFEYRNDL